MFCYNTQPGIKIDYLTYGPFKIIGGLKKGHPTEKEIQDAVDFYNGLGA